jgi:hypothetical protein
VSALVPWWDSAAITSGRTLKEQHLKMARKVSLIKLSAREGREAARSCRVGQETAENFEEPAKQKQQWGDYGGQKSFEPGLTHYRFVR